MSRKLNCSILTPEKPLYEGEIDFAVVQAYNGEVGFLFNHAPLISQLGVGEVRLRTPQKTDYVYIENGIVEIKDNKLIIIAEHAKKKDQLDKNDLENQLKVLSTKLIELKPFSEERMMIQADIKILKEKLKVACR